MVFVVYLMQYFIERIPFFTVEQHHFRFTSLAKIKVQIGNVAVNVANIQIIPAVVIHIKYQCAPAPVGGHHPLYLAISINALFLLLSCKQF